MAYREMPPPRPLRDEVECTWTAEVTAAQSLSVLPDGCMDLVWTGDQLLVAGPDTAPHPARRDPGVVNAGLRFAPGRLPALLGLPAAAVRDQRVPLEDLHPALARRAVMRLEGGAPPAAVLGDLALVLPGERADRAVRVIADQLARGHAVAATADRLGWTPRTLHRRCLAAFGYGPAVLRRVLRFRRAGALLSAGLPLAEVAALAGYADQPHLSREVRALAGTSPSALHPAAGGADRAPANP